MSKSRGREKYSARMERKRHSAERRRMERKRKAAVHVLKTELMLANLSFYLLDVCGFFASDLDDI